MASAWYQVSCDLPAPMAETLADHMAELTGCGVCTDNRCVDTFSPDDIPELRSVTITGYFAVPCPIEEHIAELSSFLYRQRAAFSDFKPVPPTVQLIGEEDWATSWKAHFKPLPIGSRLLICPTWETPSAEEKRLIITLDPGMAFGTGGHETTRLCLECLEPLLLEGVVSPSTPVLDLGTGSGLLAIAAAKLGATRIDAVDIDPQAVLVAEENCRLNRVAGAVVCGVTPLEQLTAQYALILANILAEELVRLGPELVKRLLPGGILILSGILEEREAFVIDGFSPLQVDLMFSRAAGEWRCLQYRRRS